MQARGQFDAASEQIARQPRVVAQLGHGNRDLTARLGQQLAILRGQERGDIFR